MRVVRIFVSSPNDAMAERRRISRVVERLNVALADSVRLDAVRWEERFYAAHDGFQPQIPRSGECDIVLAVLRGRIGSPLSAAFHEALPPEEQPPPGQTYPSGTAYEIMSAIRARQEGRYGDSPDVYIFRWPTPPQVSLDAPDRADVEAQWAALKRFTDAVFLTAEGQFKGAYQTYSSLDDFEAQTEALLRDWLRRHVLGDRSVLWPAERGSPFRGLAPFGMAHAAVFFGRSREIARAAERLKASAADGMPVQLVIGPSGAGKSSFLRAGLVPRLIAPGEVEGVGTWRVALMRPGESPEGPVSALARRLFEAAGAIDPAEAGRPEALPELAEGTFATPEALARQLAHADETSTAPVLAALARVSEAARERWGSERPEPARLLLVVDQLDELFATAVAEEQRATFARLLETLARTGSVWVVLSLRAEFYEVFLKSPLAGLVGDERALTLKPPGLAEMAEIVREPARAADLDWEKDAATGERLDERLLADIDRPDLLPLLQFVLDRLYEKREGGRGEPQRLTFAAYRALGTLDGAICEEAERAFGRLGAAEQAALPRLLRGLVVPAQGGGAMGASAEAGSFALVPAALAAVAPSEAGRRLAAALVDARLLSSGVGEDGAATIGLAHQRVIEAWDRARTIVAESAAFHRVRAGIGSRRRDWEGAKRPVDLLLPRGAFLAEAEEVAAAYGDEIAPEDLAYLQASRRHAGRALRRAYALAVLFAVVAVGAVAAGVVAYQQRQTAETQRQLAETEQRRAERNFTLARETVDRVISDVAGGLRNVEGMRIATVARILGRVQDAMDQLTQAAPDEPKIQSSRAAMLTQFAETFYANGDVPAAAKAYQAAIDIDRGLVRRDPDERAWQHGLAAGLNKLAFLNLRAGDAPAARAGYTEALGLFRTLAARDPGNGDWQAMIAFDLGKLGELKMLAGDAAAARADYEQSAAIAGALVKRDPSNNMWQYYYANGLSNVAFQKLRAGDAVAARADLAESVATMRTLVERVPDNNLWQRELGFKLDALGRAKLQAGDIAGALAAFEEALNLRRALVKRDPDNALWQSDLPRSLDSIGDVKLRLGDAAAARAAFEEGLTIARTLVERDPENTGRQRDLSSALSGLGAMKQRAGDMPGALAAYTERVAVARALAGRDPQNVGWQNDLLSALNAFGAVKQQMGDANAARVARDEALGLRRALTNRSAAGTGPDGAGPGDPDGAEVPRSQVAQGLARTSTIGAPVDREMPGRPADVAGAKGEVRSDGTGASTVGPTGTPVSTPKTESVTTRQPLGPALAQSPEPDRRAPPIAPQQPSGRSDADDDAPSSAGGPAALELREKQVADARDRLQRDPDNAGWQRRLAFGLGRLAAAKSETGDAAGALAARAEILSLRRALAKRNPDDTDWQNELAFALFNLADLKMKAGQAADARNMHAEALGLRRTLVKRDPGNADWQRQLGFSLMRVGNGKAQVGDIPGARAAFEEAVAVRGALAGRNPENAEWRNERDLSQKRLDGIKRQAASVAAARGKREDASGPRRPQFGSDPQRSQP